MLERHATLIVLRKTQKNKKMQILQMRTAQFISFPSSSFVMADFNNLLGDPTNDALSYSESSAHADQGELDEPRFDADEQDIPPALAQAEIQRRRMYDKLLQSPDATGTKKQSGLFEGDDEEENIQGLDPYYEKLKVLWLDELNAPELLPWDEETFSYMAQLLTDCHEDVLVQLRSQARPSAGSGRSAVDPTLASLAASICQMDADRVAFMLADLARIRMFKIEKYALHNVEAIDRLSDLERQYLKSYGELWQRHMETNVTNHFPKEIFSKLNEPEMIDHPDLDSFVFCQVVDRAGVQLDKYTDFPKVGEEDDYDRVSDLYNEGSCLFLRYALVKDLVLEGKVILLM